MSYSAFQTIVTSKDKTKFIDFLNAHEETKEIDNYLIHLYGPKDNVENGLTLVAKHLDAEALQELLKKSSRWALNFALQENFGKYESGVLRLIKSISDGTVLGSLLKQADFINIGMGLAECLKPLESPEQFYQDLIKSNKNINRNNNSDSIYENLITFCSDPLFLMKAKSTTFFNCFSRVLLNHYAEMSELLHEKELLDSNGLLQIDRETIQREPRLRLWHKNHAEIRDLISTVQRSQELIYFNEKKKIYDKLSLLFYLYWQNNPKLELTKEISPYTIIDFNDEYDKFVLEGLPVQVSAEIQFEFLQRLSVNFTSLIDFLLENGSLDYKARLGLENKKFHLQRLYDHPIPEINKTLNNNLFNIDKLASDEFDYAKYFINFYKDENDKGKSISHDLIKLLFNQYEFEKDDSPHTMFKLSNDFVNDLWKFFNAMQNSLPIPEESKAESNLPPLMLAAIKCIKNLKLPKNRNAQTISDALPIIENYLNKISKTDPEKYVKSIRFIYLILTEIESTCFAKKIEPFISKKENVDYIKIKPEYLKELDNFKKDFEDVWEDYSAALIRDIKLKLEKLNSKKETNLPGDLINEINSVHTLLESGSESSNLPLYKNCISLLDKIRDEYAPSSPTPNKKFTP